MLTSARLSNPSYPRRSQNAPKLRMVSLEPYLIFKELSCNIHFILLVFNCQHKHYWYLYSLLEILEGLIFFEFFWYLFTKNFSKSFDTMLNY